MRTIDLHTHTTASDGTLTPTELVQYALEKKLSAIAVTDHDTTAGLDEAIEAGKKYNLEVIPGIEIATVVDTRDVHLLGLFIDHHSKVMREQVEKMASVRQERNLLMVDKLKENGINIDRSDLDRFKGQSIARGHIADILIERGYATDLKDALRKYMNPGSLGYVQKKTDEAQAVIDVIHQSGGICIIAHINQIYPENYSATQKVIEKLIGYQVDGIETHYCEYDKTYQERAFAFVQQYNLLESGGSDFHGTRKKNLDLGIGYGNLNIPYTILEKQKEYLNRIRSKE